MECKKCGTYENVGEMSGKCKECFNNETGWIIILLAFILVGFLIAWTVGG